MKLMTGVALTVTALAATLSISTAAQAAGGYQLQGRYGHSDQCAGIGYYGQQNHQWAQYYCNTVTPAGATGPGLYELWVA